MRPPGKKGGTGFAGRGKKASFRHSERSEESLFDSTIGKKQTAILRFAQNDSVFGYSAACFACLLLHATPASVPPAGIHSEKNAASYKVPPSAVNVHGETY
jgi:hypothetical protein